MVLSEQFLKDYDYELPESQIAQQPVFPRDQSRLLVISRAQQSWTHALFKDLSHYLKPADLVVVNNSRVIPARFQGRRLLKEGGGGRLEGLFVRFCGDRSWEVLMRSGSRVFPGFELEIFPSSSEKASVRGRVIAAREQGWLVQWATDFDLQDFGQMPLPPYMKRAVQSEDPDWYQTIYAESSGSVAAPTAGLHFTPEILQGLEAKGVQWAPVTLHVGMGTFQSIHTQTLSQHVMHEEHYEISEETREKILKCKAQGGRLLAVGTTTVRTLESATVWDASGCQSLKTGKGTTQLFIHPGVWKQFYWTDALLTNFHLPRSTLFILVCTLLGREFTLSVYQEALKKGYRFLSYGDAMLVL